MQKPTRHPTHAMEQAHPYKAIKQDAPKQHSEISTPTEPERSNRSHESAKEATTSKLSGKSEVPSHYFNITPNSVQHRHHQET